MSSKKILLASLHCQTTFGPAGARPSSEIQPRICANMVAREPPRPLFNDPKVISLFILDGAFPRGGRVNFRALRPWASNRAGVMVENLRKDLRITYNYINSIY